MNGMFSEDKFRKLIRDDAGAAAIEYAIIIMMISVTMMMALQEMGRGVDRTLTRVADALVLAERNVGGGTGTPTGGTGTGNPTGGTGTGNPTGGTGTETPGGNTGTGGCVDRCGPSTPTYAEIWDSGPSFPLDSSNAAWMQMQPSAIMSIWGASSPEQMNAILGVQGDCTFDMWACAQRIDGGVVMKINRQYQVFSKCPSTGGCPDGTDFWFANLFYQDGVPPPTEMSPAELRDFAWNNEAGRTHGQFYYANQQGYDGTGVRLY